ncbi:MAG: CBS domain-containing protein [Pyrodictiaceae archaeon]
MASIRDVMRTEPLVKAKPDDSVFKAVTLMHENNVGSVLVVDNEGRLVGIFTERDLVHIVAERRSLDTRLEEVMTRKLVTASPDESLAIVASRMIEHGIRHIPVVDSEGRPIGVVSIRDLLRHVIASGSWP